MRNSSYKKPPRYTDPCIPWLMRLSKAALADCVVDLLRGGSECCDDEIPLEHAMDRLTPVLNLRDDTVPKVRRK